MSKTPTPFNNDLPVDSSSVHSKDLEQKRVVENHSISLLEEKLLVNRNKKKIGEVVIRKETETKMVHIPVRCEKLIIEKAGVTTEHLAEVNLSEEEVNGVKFSEFDNVNDIYQVQSEFVSLEEVKALLAKMTANSTQNNTKVRLEIITDSSESQQVYQRMLEQP